MGSPRPGRRNVGALRFLGKSVREVNTMTIAGRGSEWHRWEPHVHAPGTVLEDRYPTSGWDAYLTALETASPPLAAIGITDYCITRSEERRVGKECRSRWS